MVGFALKISGFSVFGQLEKKQTVTSQLKKSKKPHFFSDTCIIIGDNPVIDR